MRIKVVELWVVVVTGHKEILLVFVGRGVGRRWLHGLSEPCKVKLVGIAFPVHLGHNVLIVVVSQRAAEFVVVHVGFGLPLAPAACHLIRVHELKLAVGSLPQDTVDVTAVREKLQEELPQLDLTATCRVRNTGVSSLIITW